MAEEIKASELVETLGGFLTQKRIKNRADDCLSKDVDTKPLSSEPRGSWLWDGPTMDTPWYSNLLEFNAIPSRQAPNCLGVSLVPKWSWPVVSIVSLRPRFLHDSRVLSEATTRMKKVIPAIYGLYHDFTGWIFPLRWRKPSETATFGWVISYKICLARCREDMEGTGCRNSMWHWDAFWNLHFEIPLGRFVVTLSFNWVSFLMLR